MTPRRKKPCESWRDSASVVGARAVLIALVCLASLSSVAAQTQTFVAPKAEVKNVTFNRTGTTFTVTYDLEVLDPSAANAVFEVILEVTLDDGSLFRPVSVSGDMGDDVKVTPGIGKKIVWESSRDIDNQGYDKFEFAVQIVSADLMEAGEEETAGGEDPGPDPVEPTGPSLPGTWLGTYVGFPAQLDIQLLDATNFIGVLYVATKDSELATALDVTGLVLEDGQALEFRETQVRERGGERSWNLGSASGRFAGDGNAMAGSGSDGDADYQWMFTRPALAGFDVGAIWNGEYAGEPAQLTIESRDTTNWAGRLRVTTRNGRAPTELQVQGAVSNQGVQIREVRLIDLGAESSWNLGTGVGTFESGGLQLIGAGTDANGKSYEFFLLRSAR